MHYDSFDDYLSAMQGKVDTVELAYIEADQVAKEEPKKEPKAEEPAEEPKAEEKPKRKKAKK